MKMVFSRRSLRLRPITTIKHVIDNQGGLVAGTPAKVNIASAVDAPTLATANQVEVSSHINALFLNVQVAATATAALANVYMILYGNPGANIDDANIPNANVVGTSDFKKMVFHQEMIMTEKNTTAIPRTLFKGVILLPRKFRRMGIGDKIAIQLFSPGVNFDYCFQCIFKEIR